MKGWGIVLIAVLLLLVAPGRQGRCDEPADPCDVPEDLSLVNFPADHVYDRIHANQPIRLLVIGSTSSSSATIWSGRGQVSAFRAFPRFLEGAMAALRPGLRTVVTDRTAAGQTVTMVLAQLPSLLAQGPFDLVVWEAGTTDAVRRLDVNAFGDSLDEGLKLIAAKGLDAILVDVQYSPQTDALYDFQPYLDYLQEEAESVGANLLRRHEIMRFYVDNGRFDPGAPGPVEQMKNATFVHQCLAKRLATMILTAGQVQ